MIYERIKELCKANDISVNELEKRTGVAKGYLCKVDTHKPSADKMRAIADELKTSVDYLTTGKEIEFTAEMAMIDVELSNMEKRVKEYALKLASLSEEDKQMIMKMIDRCEGKYYED